MKLTDPSLVVKPVVEKVIKDLIRVNDRRRVKPSPGDLVSLGKTISLPCIHDLHVNCQLGDKCWCCCHAIAAAERRRVAESLVDRFLHRYD